MRFVFCLLLTAMVTTVGRGDEAPQWIWLPGGATDQAILRTTFTVDGPIKKAVVVAAADNGFELQLNQKQVLRGDSWQSPEIADVTKQLVEGPNVLAVAASNEGGVAAFMLELRITTADGATRRVVTGPQWLTRESRTKQWNGLEVDAAEWKPAQLLGRVGEPSLPWSRAVNADVIDGLLVGGDGSTYQPSVAENVTTINGFVVEKVFNVPRVLGSWVSLTTDKNGSLIASDQGGAGLFRITPGRDGEATTVARIPVDISGAQGLLWAFDSLYVMVNGGPASGLHRITDSDGDGELDRDEHLMPIEGGGEHGPHAIVLSPDKKSLFVCAGNHTKLPKEISNSRIPRNWGEDLLLPRRWDANGHAAGILAPGGWICRIDPDGKEWEVHSIGFRNEYDIAFNQDGELFSYDADMEWDLGSPWYRPTRVVHATSGSEFGWRSGTGKWPAYYEDSLPGAIDVGPGSPVGMVFGYGTRFPAKYQQALFILDWTYSTIYAVHLTPEGSTYRGEKEDFVTGQPLQVTDAVVGSDGDLYFTTGGRGTQSALYRVAYRGDAGVDPVDARNTAEASQRQLRHALEAEHGEENADDVEALDEIIAQLGHADRFIRYAARIALETRPIDAWRDQVLQLEDDQARVNAAIAIARQGTSDDLAANLKLLAKVRTDQGHPQLELGRLRAYQLTFARLGQPSDAQRNAVLQILDPLYPMPRTQNPEFADAVNAELVQLLVYLNAPDVVGRTLELMTQLGPEPIPDWGYLVERHRGYGGTVGELLDNMTPARAIHYAFVLRNQKEGWTIDQRRRYFEFFIEAAKHPGGNSYTKFLSQMRDDALATCSPAEQVLVDAVAGVSLLAEPPKVDPPSGPGREWQASDVLTSISELKKRNFNHGRNLFHATQCAKCHRLGGEGGAIGPDLSTAGRKFPLPDLVDAVVEPSKAISDQYGSHQVLTADGNIHVGRVVTLDGKLHVYTADPDKPPVIIDEEDAEEVTESKVSQMPTDLVNSLNEEELKDLFAYVLSGGNPQHQVYK